MNGSFVRHNNHHLLLSSLLKHPIEKHSRRAMQQIHSHIITSTTTSSGLPPQIIVASLNAIIRHYSLSSFPEDALHLYKQFRPMSSLSFENSFTYSFLIKACTNLHCIALGVQLHCQTFKVGFLSHVYVQTSLVNLYAACGFLEEAERVFNEMPERNSVTWNALITGLVLWDKVGRARRLFDEMPEKNVVSWTGLINGYTRMNRHNEALSLFRRMVVHEGIKPTEVTVLAILPAIWNLRAVELCQSVHCYGEKGGFSMSDIRVLNSLVDAYAKCGCLGSAERVFEGVSPERRNLVSWTSIISGLAMHGMAKEAAYAFAKMEGDRVKPNRVTFLSILNACSHGGMVEEGLWFFRKMVNEYDIVPDIKHYGSVIDMLGRAGRLEEAEKMALGIPAEMSNAVVWRTLLGACSLHGNAEIGDRARWKIMEMEKKYGGDYVLLSNIFAGVGRFVDSERVRRMMDDGNATKVPGISLI